LNGTTDKQRKFHCTLLSICSNETQADFAFTFKALTNALLKHNNYVYRPRALIADAAGAITQGFETAFNYTKGDYLRVVCYVHVERAIKDTRNATYHHLSKEQK
jgi:hypothetical protein